MLLVLLIIRSFQQSKQTVALTDDIILCKHFEIRACVVGASTTRTS